jgi:hypothetical protein
MTRKKVLERWEAQVGNAEVTPQALWHIAKSLLKRNGPRAPSAIHGSSGLKFYPSKKANTIADCLEIQFSPHYLWTKTMNGGWRLQSKFYMKP